MIILSVFGKIAETICSGCNLQYLALGKLIKKLYSASMTVLNDSSTLICMVPDTGFSAFFFSV